MDVGCPATEDSSFSCTQLRWCLHILPPDDTNRYPVPGTFFNEMVNKPQSLIMNTKEAYSEKC
jgi:hypothetical protein